MAFPAIFQLTMGAAFCASVISYLLILGALFSDRNENGRAMDYLLSTHGRQFDDDKWHSLSTDILGNKKTLLVRSLVNGEEWRISAASVREKRAISNGRTDYDDDDDLNCDEISKMTPTMDFLAAGWTKAVYKARTIDNRTVAVKTIDMTGQDMTKCMMEQRKLTTASDPVEVCYQRAVKKLVKEIVVLKLLLQHPNVVKLLGYCIPKTIDSRSPGSRVSLVTELGEPVNLIRLLQMSWEDRLRVVLAVTRLTDYLSQHPSGSLVLNDMRRQQFVVSKEGELKLVDVDDIGLEEPACENDQDCEAYLTQVLGLDSSNVTLKCSNEKICYGANELRNMYNAARHFTTFLLPYGVPTRLQPEVDQLVEAYRHLTLPVHQLKERTEGLVHQYASGSYLMGNDSYSSDFIAWPNSDLPGQFDYPCESSFSQVGCSLSVASLAEARQLCAVQSACRAFVWTNDQTWTGRTIVHFKNDVRTPSRRINSTLYVKMVQ